MVHGDERDDRYERGVSHDHGYAETADGRLHPDHGNYQNAHPMRRDPSYEGRQSFSHDPRHGPPEPQETMANGGSYSPHDGEHHQNHRHDQRHEQHHDHHYKGHEHHPYLPAAHLPYDHQHDYHRSPYLGTRDASLYRHQQLHSMPSVDNQDRLSTSVSSSSPRLTLPPPTSLPPLTVAPNPPGYEHGGAPDPQQMPMLYQLTPITYRAPIIDVQPEDVLSGRGGATNAHSGNRYFRKLVKDYQGKYLEAKKKDKPAVAEIVVEKIRAKGGRFLNREKESWKGQVMWYDIGDEKAREKTCQALRENAPELRRKRKATPGGEDDSKRSDAYLSPCSDGASASKSQRSSPNIRSTTTSIGNSPHGHPAQTTPRSRGMVGQEYQVRNAVSDEEPLVIRPSALLMRRREMKEIKLKDLTKEERELYLTDFLPPRAGASSISTSSSSSSPPTPSLSSSSPLAKQEHSTLVSSASRDSHSFQNPSQDGSRASTWQVASV